MHFKREGNFLSRSEWDPFLYIWYRTVRTQNGLSPSPFTQRYFVWLKLAQWFVKKKIFKFHQYIFALWKKEWPFIWALNPLHPMMFCAKFSWIWSSGSREEGEHMKSLQTDDKQSEKFSSAWNFFFNRRYGIIKAKLCKCVS